MRPLEAADVTISRQGSAVVVPEVTLLVYEKNCRAEAIRTAGALRSCGENVQLLRKRSVHPLEDYRDYAYNNQIGRICYLDETGLHEVN